MTSFFIYLIFSYASALSYTLLNEPYSSQLIGGASEVDQHAMVLCLIPSLSPYWVFKLTMWMRQASRFQLCWQRRPLWEMGNMAVCVCHSSVPTLKGEGECVVFSLLYLVCIAFMLRRTGGVRAKAGVLSRWRSLDLMHCQEEKDSFAKCFHKYSLRHTNTYYRFPTSPNQIFECHSNFSMLGVLNFIIIILFTYIFI